VLSGNHSGTMVQSCTLYGNAKVYSQAQCSVIRQLHCCTLQLVVPQTAQSNYRYTDSRFNTIVPLVV